LLAVCEANGWPAAMVSPQWFAPCRSFPCAIFCSGGGARYDIDRDRWSQARGQAQGRARQAAEQLLQRISLLLVLTFALAGCGHNVAPDSDNEINVYPANYKSDILAAMHAYLNDPTGIRDAAISEPTLKSSGNLSRYIACVRFTPKKNAKEYAFPKEIAAVFLAGRFDRFIDTPKDECAGAAYAAFPELQKLSP
jgi:hypothetical protein